MKVYELRNGGSHSSCGFFQSVERAKAEATKILDSYHEFDGDDDVEQVNFDAEWEMKRETIGKNPVHEIGEPKPTLVYGLTYDTAFRVITHEVLP